MLFFPVKRPKIIKRIFPNYVWDFSSKSKTIYLTFDDGPTPEITTWVLNILKQYNAKATFFCIGNNIEKYPEIFKQIITQKHSIGNHTFNHNNGWKTTSKTYIESVEKAQNTIQALFNNYNTTIKTQQINKIFRPPFGKIKNSQGKALINKGYKIIMWSIISLDWKQNIKKEQCLKNVLSKTTNGNIVVFHDSIKASKNMMYALPKVLEYYSKKGYVFKGI